MAIEDLLKRLDARKVATLPDDWRKGRQCPECGYGAERQNCAVGFGGHCPRTDPDAYDVSPYVMVPDADCVAAAAAIRDLMGPLDKGDAS